MGLGRVRFHVKQTACGQLNFYCVANFSWSPAYIDIGRVKLDIFFRRIGWPISKMELLVCTWSRSGKQIGGTQDQRHKATSSKLVMFTISVISKMKGKKEERGFSDRSLPWVMGVVRNEHDSVKLEQAPRWLSSDATTINRVSSWRGLDHAESMLGSLASRRSIPADAPVTITQGRARCQSLNVRATHGAAALVRHCHSRCTDKPRRAMSPLSLPSAV